MKEKKKHYVSPAIETEEIDLPVAWACGLDENTANLCITGTSWSDIAGSFPQ